MIFQFLANWWPYRNEDNVLFLHFADMKRDHEGSVRKIAEFLGYEPAADEWPTILECTSSRGRRMCNIRPAASARFGSGR